MANKRIGLIIPTAGTTVPVEASLMYPDIVFKARGLGLQTMTQAGFDAVFDRVTGLASEFGPEGHDAMTLIGTSLSFYRGAEANAELVRKISQVTRLPCTSMSNAIVDGLRAVGGRRLAVATAYVDDINERLRRFLQHAGFEVLSLYGLGVEASGTAWRFGVDELVALGRKAADAASGADAILISCGGLRTLDVTVPLELATGLPVVSSMPAALWAAARLVGHDGRVPGYGRLLASSH
jgi:arylmalonate decarboxylase